MRWFLFLASLGCSSVATPSASDAGSSSVDSGSDSGVVTAEGCAVRGTGAFGVHLEGTATADGKPLTGSLDVYFPQGRAPYKPVVFVAPMYPGSVGTVTRELDSSASVAFEIRHYGCGTGIGGVLVGPIGGVTATVTVNDTAPMSDALALRSAPMNLCPAGAVPAQMATPPELTFLHTITFATTRPLRMGQIVKASNGSSFEVYGYVKGASLVPLAFTPLEEFSVDLSGIVDVLGEPLGLAVSPKHVAPSSAVADRAFDSELPAGAAIGTPAIVADGVLKLGNGGPWTTIVGLGGTTSKTLRMRHRSVCAMYATPARVAILAANGTSSAATVKCGAMADDTIVLDGPGPYTLIASATPMTHQPCMYPSYANAASYELDSYSFE